MVLESVINPLTAEKEPWEMFILGLIYSSIAVVLTLLFFGGKEASLIMVFLTVLPCVIIIHNTLRLEEKKDLKYMSEFRVLEEHGRALAFFLFLLLGFVVAYTLWYVFLPSSITETFFFYQIEAIKDVNNMSGFVTQFLKDSGLAGIFLNNFKVLLFSILFSFFFGLGAIFIIVWNAAVVGVAAGEVFKSFLERTLESVGFVSVSAYFSGISLSIMKFMFHGIPEIGAYIIGGLAGGLISVAIVNYKSSPEQFKKVLKDSGVLFFIAVVVLVIAAIMEVYITPVLFKGV